jgi:hypothetical protein
MFSLSESQRPHAVVRWILHGLAAVILPKLLVGVIEQLVTPLRHFDDSLSYVGQEVLAYFLLSIAGAALGMMMVTVHPSSSGVARKAWIIPCSLFFFCGLSDLVTSNFDWSYIFYDYVLAWPPRPGWLSPLPSFILLTGSAVASAGYSLGGSMNEFYLRKPPADGLTSK